jgi:hypothetical protein
VCVSVSVRESICCDSRFGAYYNTSIMTATRWNLEIVREPESPKLAFHPFRSPLSCHFIPFPHISPTVQSPYSPPVGSAKTGLTGSFQVWQHPARTCHKGLSPQRKLKRHGKARSNMSNDRTCCAPADLGAGANSSSPCAWRHSCTKNLAILETNAGMLYHQLRQTNTTWTAVDAFLCALYKHIQTIPCFGSFAASFAVFCRYLPHMCHQKVLSQAASALQVELAQRCLQVPQGANAMRHATSKIKVGCLV